MYLFNFSVLTLIVAFAALMFLPKRLGSLGELIGGLMATISIALFFGDCLRSHYGEPIQSFNILGVSILVLSLAVTLVSSLKRLNVMRFACPILWIAATAAACFVPEVGGFYLDGALRLATTIGISVLIVTRCVDLCEEKEPDDEWIESEHNK